MTPLLAEGPPGTHPTYTIPGCHLDWNVGIGTIHACTFNTDSLLSSAVAIVVTLIVGLAVAYRLSHGTPGKLQMLFEFFVGYVRDLVRDTVHPQATFVVPLAATIGFYILVANWLDFLPLPAPLHPANSDWNQTLAMAIVVILVVQWYSIREQGFGGYLRRFTKPFGMPIPVRALFVPLNLIEEIAKPVTLSLRLFGNIFAGVLMVYLLTLLPVTAVSSPIPVAAWKFFDVFFVGTIQAFIFMLLTVIYFHMAREGMEEEH